jgi:hypothetical protein
MWEQKTANFHNKNVLKYLGENWEIWSSGWFAGCIFWCETIFVAISQVFFSDFRKSHFNTALRGKWVYLTGKRGFRDVEVNPTKIPSVYDLLIMFYPGREKRNKSICMFKSYSSCHRARGTFRKHAKRGGGGS